MHVPGADRRRDERLVGGLVGTEADIPVGPHDTGLAPLRPELVKEGLHRSEDRVLIRGLVALPVGLRVVGLEALEKIEGLLRPSLEHGYTSSTKFGRPRAYRIAQRHYRGM